MMTITDLSNHPGIIAFKERETKIIKSYHLHIHKVDVEKFQSNIRILNQTLKILKQNNTMTEYNDISDVRMTSLLESFFRLKPIKRSKRGILNPLGSIIKSITGNLDDNDMKDIKRSFDQTENKINELVKNNERQIEINKDFENRINLIIENINKQQSKILKQLAKLDDNDIDNKNLYIKQHFHTTLFNIELLERKIRDIFESIQFAKIGILSKAILNPKETDFALEKLENQNVTINSIDEIYEYLEINVFHNYSNIVFVVKIPVFLEGNYYYINYESIPYNNRTISSNYNIAITSQTSTFASKEHCSIIEQYRICKQHTLINITNDGCIHNTLWGHNAACPHTEFRQPLQIKRINANTLLVINAINPLTINSNCDSTNRTVKGTLLITFSECIITINNERYDTEQTTGYDETKLIPTIGIIINQTTFVNQPDIFQLHKLNIVNREHIKQIKLHQTIIRNTTIGGFLALLLVSSSLGVWILLSIKRNRATMIKVNVDNLKQSSELSHYSKNGNSNHMEIRDESSHRGEKLSTSSYTKGDSSSVSSHKLPLTNKFTFPTLKVSTSSS